METREKKKTFDAVKMMREIRDKISQDTKDMNFEQLKKFLALKTKNSPTKKLGG